MSDQKKTYDAQLIRQLLSNKEAAYHISCSANTLKQSRSTGKLFGVEAPAFLKMGYTIRYQKATLDKWLSQFEEVANTAQN